MENLILKDQSVIEIEEGYTVARLVTYVDTYADLQGLAEKLTQDNLSTVKRVSQTTEEVLETYSNMAAMTPLFKIDPAGDQLQVIFGLRQLMEEELKAPVIDTAITYLTDEQALTVKALYPDYAYGVLYKQGGRAVYHGILYKALQGHTSQEGWEPGVAPSLWVALESGSEAGTLEDPIPVPDTVTTSGMEYVYGRYYKEGDTVYLCQRGGVEDPDSMYGKTVTLSYPPSALIGQYFVAAEK